MTYEPKARLPDSPFFSPLFLEYTLEETDTEVGTIFFIYS